MTQMH